MKILGAMGLLLLMQGLSVQAAERQACDVRVAITDNDPKGTNIRSAPGGPVLTVLKSPSADNNWIEVHVTAQVGDWFEIDHALLADGDKTVFKGTGYLHRSMVGISGVAGGGAVYANHDAAGAKLDVDDPPDAAMDLLGCWGEFLHVQIKGDNRAKGQKGWVNAPCTNMVTTCV